MLKVYHKVYLTLTSNLSVKPDTSADWYFSPQLRNHQIQSAADHSGKGDHRPFLYADAAHGRVLSPFIQSRQHGSQIVFAVNLVFCGLRVALDGGLDLHNLREVYAGKREKDIFICFINQGKTIPAEKLNSIFEKFFRLDEARSTNTGGAGLGLAIAKEIVTLHGGAINATSEDERTTFSVSLPQY